MNAALANNLGNMLNRTLTLLHKNCGGEVVADVLAEFPEDAPLRVLARWGQGRGGTWTQRNEE